MGAVDIKYHIQELRKYIAFMYRPGPMFNDGPRGQQPPPPPPPPPLSAALFITRTKETVSVFGGEQRVVVKERVLFFIAMSLACFTSTYKERRNGMIFGQLLICLQHLNSLDFEITLLLTSGLHNALNKYTCKQ